MSSSSGYPMFCSPMDSLMRMTCMQDSPMYIPRHSMYGIFTYIGVVFGGQCRHIWHTWSVWDICRLFCPMDWRSGDRCEAPPEKPPKPEIETGRGASFTCRFCSIERHRFHQTPIAGPAQTPKWVLEVPRDSPTFSCPPASPCTPRFRNLFRRPNLS